MVKQIPYYEWNSETAHMIPFVMDDDGTKLRKNSHANITVSNKRMLRFEVRDNGAGVSPENQTKLFGKYVQISARKLQKGTTIVTDTNIATNTTTNATTTTTTTTTAITNTVTNTNTTTNKGNGTGLGLWISRQLVEMSNGRMSMWSEGEGKGSRFFFEIPLFETTDYEDFDNSFLPSVPVVKPDTSRSSSTNNPKSVTRRSFNTFGDAAFRENLLKAVLDSDSDTESNVSTSKAPTEINFNDDEHIDQARYYYYHYYYYCCYYYNY